MEINQPTVHGLFISCVKGFSVQFSTEENEDYVEPFSDYAQHELTFYSKRKYSLNSIWHRKMKFSIEEKREKQKTNDLYFCIVNDTIILLYLFLVLRELLVLMRQPKSKKKSA